MAPENGGPGAPESCEESPKVVEGMVQNLLAQGAITKVPDRFVRNPEERIVPEKQIKNSSGPPVIDMGALMACGDDRESKHKRAMLMAEISDALEDWGVFQGVNHGVCKSLMDKAMEMHKKFFALSAEEKAVYRTTTTAGVGYGRLFEMDKGAKADWLDRINMWAAPKEMKEKEPLNVQNPPGFQEMFDEYGDATFELMLKVLELLSENVGQPSDYIYNKIGGIKAGMRTYFNYYPPCPQPELAMGLSKHSDLGILTALQQGNVSGLELLRNGNWITVPTVPHAFVFFTADALQIMTNDKVKSCVHRAVATHEGRYTIGNFYFPDWDTLVEPAKEFCTVTHPPLYRPYIFKDFLMELVKGPLGGERFMDRYRLVQP